MAQPQFPVREKTIMDDISLRLSAEPLPNGTGRPTLKVYPNGKNSIRIDIYTNMPGEDNNGNIRADVGYTDWQAICDTLVHLANPSTPNDTVYKWESVEFTFFGGKRSETRQLVFNAFAGKDENGRIYFSITLPKAGSSAVQFFLDAAMRLRMLRVKGGDMSPAELSAVATRAWVNRANSLLNHVLITTWKDKSKDQQGGNRNGGGGYQRNNNNGGGYNNNQGGGYNQGGGSAPSADDLPF